MPLRAPLPHVNELAAAFGTAALRENEPKRSGKMRRFVYLLTDNKLKLKEFVRVFDRYGIEVLQFPAYLPVPFIHALLVEKTADLVPLACLKEDSRLYRPGTTEDSSQRPGALANHFSILRAWSRQSASTGGGASGRAVTMTKYIHTTAGRMCERVVGVWNTGPVFGWDDQFVLLATGKTYQEHLQSGLKISSRDMVISAYLEDKVYYKQLKNLKHTPLELNRPVDFNVDVACFVRQESLFNTACAQSYGLVNMLTHVLNEGIFFKGADTRLEANYWQPGLNAGLPLMSKKDNIHEKTFMFHDFGHFLMKDLIFTGSDSPLHRNVYIIHRMISEAVTIMLADGVFVDSMQREGVDYDFSERRIYPLVCDAGLDIGCCDTDRDGYVVRLKNLFKASVDFTVKGDDSTFKGMLRKNGADYTNWEKYRAKFHPFFVSDLQWTAHNYQNMSSRANEMTLWWNLTAPVRAQLDLRLETIDDFIADLPAAELSDAMMYPDPPALGDGIDTKLTAGDSGSISRMVDLVFEAVFERRLGPVFAAGGSLPLEEPEKRYRRGFLRYMIGQMGIYARFWSVPATKTYYEELVDMLTDASPCPPSIADVRIAYESFVDLLASMNLISADDSHNFKETYPLFEPFYVTYDKPEEYPDLAGVVEDTLSLRSYHQGQRDLAEQFMGRALTASEERYRECMGNLIEHCGGQIEQGVFVTAPGVLLLAMDEPVSDPGQPDAVAGDVSSRHASFLLCGVALETSLELIAHGEASVARLTSSKTSSMNVPLYRVQQSVARETMEYLQLMQHSRTPFETRHNPRSRWECGVELFNGTAPGCKATALVYTMTLGDFHKLFIGRMGEAGNELEVRQVVRAMAARLHARHPEIILAPDEYLRLSNGEKYLAHVPVALGETVRSELPYLNVEADTNAVLRTDGDRPRTHAVSDTVLSADARTLFRALNIRGSAAGLSDAFQLAEFRSRITYLAFPRQPAAGQTEAQVEAEGYMRKMVHELEHLSVVSAVRATVAVPVPIPMTVDAEAASCCPAVLVLQQQVMLTGGVATVGPLIGQPVGRTDDPGGQSVMFDSTWLTISMNLKGFHKLFHSMGKLTASRDVHGLRDLSCEMATLFHEKYGFVISSPAMYKL